MQGSGYKGRSPSTEGFSLHLLAVACALVLAACGTPAYTTVKSGEGQEFQKLADQRYRDYDWPGTRIPKRDQDRDLNALAVADAAGNLYVTEN